MSASDAGTYREIFTERVKNYEVSNPPPPPERVRSGVLYIMVRNLVQYQLLRGRYYPHYTPLDIAVVIKGSA